MIMRCVVKASFTGKMILGTRVILRVTSDTAKDFTWTPERNGPMPVSGIVERNTEKALYTTRRLLKTPTMDIGFMYVSFAQIIFFQYCGSKPTIPTVQIGR